MACVKCLISKDLAFECSLINTDEKNSPPVVEVEKQGDNASGSSSSSSSSSDSGSTSSGTDDLISSCYLYCSILLLVFVFDTFGVITFCAWLLTMYVLRYYGILPADSDSDSSSAYGSDAGHSPKT